MLLIDIAPGASEGAESKPAREDGMVPSTAAAAGRDKLDPKQPIVMQIYRRIRRDILAMRLKPTEALSENELAIQFGVSRTPVREALIKLSEDGLVDILPQRGSFVAPIRIQEVLEAQFIREALETAVIRRLAAAPGAVLLARLDALLARQLSAIEDGMLEEFLVLDASFHQALCEACGLSRGWKIVQNVKGQLERVCAQDLPDPGHQRTLYEQHADIVAAVRSRQPDLAAERTRVHLREVFKSIDLLLRTQPSMFADKGTLAAGDPSTPEGMLWPR